MIPKTKSVLSNVTRLLFQKDASISTISFNAHLRRSLRLWLPMLGWPGILAIGLLAVCLPFYISTIRPLQEQLDVALSSTSAAREQMLAAGTKGYAGGGLPGEQLAKFYQFFPAERNSPIWLGKMIEVAEKNGLSLNHGEYIVARDKVGELIRIKITLPVQGNYPQLRKFLAALATEIPVMALENVQFERKDILDTTVQVKLKLVLYLVQES